MTEINNDQQLQLLVECGDEIAKTALFLDGMTYQTTGCPPHQDHLGAYIPMFSESDDTLAVDVGIAADQETCRMLASALMGMGIDEEEDEEEPLSTADVADALGEIANLIAGAFKARVAQHGVAPVLGTPMVLEGKVIQIRNQTCDVAVCSMGAATVELVILRNCPVLQASR